MAPGIQSSSAGEKPAGKQSPNAAKSLAGKQSTMLRKFRHTPSLIQNTTWKPNRKANDPICVGRLLTLYGDMRSEGQARLAALHLEPHGSPKTRTVLEELNDVCGAMNAYGKEEVDVMEHNNRIRNLRNWRKLMFRECWTAMRPCEESVTNLHPLPGDPKRGRNLNIDAINAIDQTAVHPYFTIPMSVERMWSSFSDQDWQRIDINLFQQSDETVVIYLERLEGDPGVSAQEIIVLAAITRMKPIQILPDVSNIISVKNGKLIIKDVPESGASLPAAESAKIAKGSPT